LGRPLEGPVLQQGELSVVCLRLSEREKSWGATGGAWQNFGGAVAPPDTPLAPPLAVTLASPALHAREIFQK